MTTLSFKPPLQHVCLLRLSAIGDTCHALAALRAFQSAWPETRFTWIIGKVEAKLMREILPEIEFITFDKAATLRELWRLRALLRGRRFDLLLDMQLSFRASLVSRLGPCSDQAGVRSASGHASCNGCSPTRELNLRLREHVLDSFMGFVRACGIEAERSALGHLTCRPSSLDYARGVDRGRSAHAADQSLFQPHGAKLVGREIRRGRRSRRLGASHARRAGGGPQLRGGAHGRRDRRRGAHAAHQSDRQGHAAATARPDVAKHRAVVAGLGARAHGDHGRSCR